MFTINSFILFHSRGYAIFFILKCISLLLKNQKTQSIGKELNNKIKFNNQISNFHIILSISLGFPGGSDGKESACSEGDLGLIPGLERSLEEEMATYSSILAWRIPRGRGAWWATVNEVTKSGARLSIKHAAYHYLVVVD